jgi:hypothetical protein
MIDLGLLGPRYDGTPDHMCALNVIALALIPGCTDVSATTPAKLSSAVMRHFKGSTSKTRTDARFAVMRAIISCGNNFRTPTENAWLSLPTIYECHTQRQALVFFFEACRCVYAYRQP